MNEDAASPTEINPLSDEQPRGDPSRVVRRRVNLPRGQMPHDPDAWFGFEDILRLIKTAFNRGNDVESRPSSRGPQPVEPVLKEHESREPTAAERDLEARLLRRRRRQQQQLEQERRFHEERERAWREKHRVPSGDPEVKEGQAVVFGHAVRGRVNFPQGQLPAFEKAQKKGAVVSVSIHLVLILLIILGPVVARRVMGEPGEPGGGGGGGGGQDIQFIELPPAAASAPAAAEQPVQAAVPPPVPVEDDIFAMPTPEVFETAEAAVDAKVAEVRPEITLESLGLGLGVGTGDGPGEGTGSGGGIGSGEGEGIGAGIGDGTGGENGDVRAPEPRTVVYPFEDPPDDVRGVEFTLHFWVDQRGRVTKVEITPNIKDSGFRNKLMDRLKAWVFYAARTTNGSPVAGEYIANVTF